MSRMTSGSPIPRADDTDSGRLATLLDRAATGPDSQAWNDLWTELYHNGSLEAPHPLVLPALTVVPDGLWELFQRVVPPAPVRPQGGGRRRYGDREVLAAIIFVATSGCTWRQLPPVFGPSGPTAHRRFTEWSRARVWAKLHRLVLDELGSRGELDWSRCAIDSVNLRALKGGS